MGCGKSKDAAVAPAPKKGDAKAAGKAAPRTATATPKAAEAPKRAATAKK